MNNQLKRLQEVIPPRAFVIPDYQRGYAWEDRHRRDLLDDLRDLAALPDATKLHYTGTLVLHRGRHGPRTVSGKSFDVLDVIDGQQRLTTLVILLAAIARRLEALGSTDARKLAGDLREAFIAVGTVQKLTPNGEAAVFYRDHVVGDAANPLPGSPPERAMLAARVQFEKFLDELLPKGADAAGGATTLGAWAALITTRLGFIIFEVEDEADVGVMFEAMNARGKALTQFELVKNYLLFVSAKVSSGDELRALTGDINDTWKKVVAALDAASLSEADDTFLRYHWWIWPLAKGLDGEPVWKTSNVHRALKETIRVKDGNATVPGRIREYLGDLRGAIRPFVDLSRPGNAKAFEYAGASRGALVDRALGVRRIGRSAVVLPLLMAAVMRLGGDAPGLVEVLRLAETFVFRLALQEMKSNTGTAVMMGLARDIRGGPMTAAAIQARLREEIQDYASDKEVERSLLEADGSKADGNFFEWAQLPHLLFEYERSLVERHSQKFAYDWDAFYARWRESIEHILPQGDNTLSVPYWGQRFTADGLKRNRHRLGNLTLTEWNSSYSNRGFDQKCGAAGGPSDAKVYRNSKFWCEKELASETSWDEAAIERRQKRLAAFAMARWKA